MMNLSEINIFIKQNPYLGYVLLIILIFFYITNNLVKSLPLFSKINAKILIPIASKIKLSFLQRAAIKNDIQGKVNSVIKVISNEIPKQRIKPIEIEWVKNTSVETFIKDNKILVRIRPLENQEDNLLNVTQPFLESILIPKCLLLIQDVQRKAIIYFTTKSVIKDNESLLNRFHDNYYLPACKNYKSLEEYFRKIEFTYNRGLFFSVGITAIEAAAEKNKFVKTNLGSDFAQILNHLVAFIENLNKLGAERNDTVWSFFGSGISYGLLLVARPKNAKEWKVNLYIKRAEEKLKTCDILFVAFSHQEKNFGDHVAKCMENQLNINLIDELETAFDYRGAFNGIVRIYRKG